jgi:hypothetical protein
MNTTERASGDRVKCEPLNFVGVIKGLDSNRTETGDFIYHIQVENKPVRRLVSIAAPHLSNA